MSNKSYRELEKKKIRETIEKNRRGERIGIVIPPIKSLQMSGDEEVNKIRVAAYCRVSTVEDAQAGSFEMQVQHFQAEVDANPEYELVKIYTDEGISGTSISKRLGFQEMMEDAKAGKIDLILTKSISRFGRNIVDIVSALRELNALNPPVNVKFESEGITTGEGYNLVISVLSALAELESQQKSIAVSEGVHYRMSEGIFKYGVDNLMGYYRDENGDVCIDEEEAKIVTHIYSKYIDGFSAAEIAYYLNYMGIPNSEEGIPWRGPRINRILSNEKYCGDVLFQKTYTVDYISHKSRKNDGEKTQWYWKDCHPAIIEKDVWEKVQIMRSERRYRKPRTFYLNRPITIRRSSNYSGNRIRDTFAVSTIEFGALTGYTYLDFSFNRAEVEMYFSILNKQLEEEDEL